MVVAKNHFPLRPRMIMKKDYVPILVQKEQNTDIWQMDVSNMNLSELIALRDALRGYHDISIRVIDGILNNNMGISFTYCRDLATVSIPSSVTTIGAYAFEGCI